MNEPQDTHEPSNVFPPAAARSEAQADPVPVSATGAGSALANRLWDEVTWFERASMGLLDLDDDVWGEWLAGTLGVLCEAGGGPYVYEALAFVEAGLDANTAEGLYMASVGSPLEYFLGRLESAALVVWRRLKPYPESVSHSTHGQVSIVPAPDTPSGVGSVEAAGALDTLAGTSIGSAPHTSPGVGPVEAARRLVERVSRQGANAEQLSDEVTWFSDACLRLGNFETAAARDWVTAGVSIVCEAGGGPDLYGMLQHVEASLDPELMARLGLPEISNHTVYIATAIIRFAYVRADVLLGDAVLEGARPDAAA